MQFPAYLTQFPRWRYVAQHRKVSVCRCQLAAREGPCDSEGGFGYLPFLCSQYQSLL
jgi:hypothetical protein